MSSRYLGFALVSLKFPIYINSEPTVSILLINCYFGRGFSFSETSFSLKFPVYINSESTVSIL